MRFLLVNDHCISDPTAGVTQSLRTIMQWLSEAGHDCRVLTTARFETPTGNITDHLAEIGVAIPPAPSAGDRPVVEYSIGGVPVTLLLTEHNDERHPDTGETRQFLDLFLELLRDFTPDVLIGCNGHPAIFAAFAAARARGIVTAFAVRGYGYYDRRYFAHVDHVFTCSDFLTRFYRDRTGLESTPLEPPIDWSTVVAPVEDRTFVTFVHPALHKGVMLFARVASMLADRRPDIPVLIVQSGRTAGILNAIPGIDFSASPQIMAAPAVPTPAEYFALTRILLVPSVWPEPFGRVAAEAMINGIPPIVSERGALPEVVRYEGREGGLVVPLPTWMTPDSQQLPSEDEAQPWFDAICRLWDDAAEYEALSTSGHGIAHARYSEAVSRKRHVDYFAGLERR